MFGYARVSTEDQNLDLQIRALKDYGCGQIFQEKRSAYGVKRRQLEILKLHLQEGDTLVVWKLDRLGRSVAELIELMAYFEKWEVNFVSLQDSIDTRTAMGKFMFHLLASLAQLERDLTAERTKAGMEAARKRGFKPGPPTLLQRMDKKELKALRKDLANPKMSWRDLHKKYGYAVATLRRHFEEERKGLQAQLAEKDEKEMEESRFGHFKLETISAAQPESLRIGKLRQRVADLEQSEFVSLQTPDGDHFTSLSDAQRYLDGVSFE
ncbi:recombinase family protein [Labrenzia sp. R4_1]|nr:recombinase family protein [Labrenzia sp. R4_1]